jgi:hypothetical protein
MKASDKQWHVEICEKWYVTPRGVITDKYFEKTRVLTSRMTLESAIQYVNDYTQESRGLKKWYCIVNLTTGIVLPGDLL